MKYEKKGYNRLFAGELYSWNSFENPLIEADYKNLAEI